MCMYATGRVVDDAGENLSNIYFFSGPSEEQQ